MRYDVALLRALFPHVRAHSERVRMPLRGLSSRQSVSLRLITPRQTAFHARDEELARFPWAQSLPGVDHESSWPWWGFCWPGGWTLASYVAKMEARKRVVALDLGSGGGVVGLSLAQALSRSSSQELRELVVVFNDIDPYSLAAAALNVEEGGLVDTDARFEYCVENLVGAKPDATTLVRAFAETNDATLDETLLLVLAGDILYDGEFGAQALDWLRSLAATKGDPNPKVEVLLGDPGRHVIGSMPENTRDETLELVFDCELPPARTRHVGEEDGLDLVPSDGFTTGRVWRVRAG